MEQLSSPDVLAFPDFDAAITGGRLFHLMTDASVDGLGAVVEQEQKYGTVRPICVLSRSTPPNERNWSATELECAAIVWAVKKNRRMFCGIPYIVVSGNQPLKTFESLATKVDRVHRWSDYLSAYNYKLVCRPGRLKCNADLLCRLPPPGTNEETNTDLRLTDQTDIDVYFDGASGVQPRMRTRTRSILGGLEQPDYTVAVGGVEHSTCLLYTSPSPRDQRGSRMPSSA